MKLNNEQNLAVNQIEGPVIIIAGAGSGKTRVLTNRIVNMLEQGIKDSEILAITFTNKAAKEMKERTQKIKENNTLITTFHSFCYKILRQHIHILGYSNGIVILDDDDLHRKLKEINDVYSIDLDVKSDLKTSKFLSYYVNKRYRGIQTLENYKTEKFEFLYNKYLEYSKRDSFLNFEDLLYLTVELFKTNTELLTYYQNKYKYILVDEYQDTNDIQNELIIMLSKKYRNIFIVGDEDQSIYAFRGANVDNLRDFKNNFPDAITIKLEENYRSTTAILNIANEVIKNNKSRVEKNLWTSNTNNELVKYYSFNDEYSELDYIISKIKELQNKGVKTSDIAILYRSGYVSKNIEKRLRLSGISYVIYGGFDFFRRVQVKQTLNYLAAVLNPENRHLIMQIINYPSRKIGATSIKEIVNVLDEVGDTAEVFSNPSNYFTKALAQKISEFYNLIVSINKEIDSLDEITDLVDLILEKTSLKNEYLSMDNGKDRLDDAYSLKDLFVEYKFEELTNKEILRLVLEETSAIYNYENLNEEKDKLILSTMHQSKGLEFDYVFLPFFDEGIFPSNMAIMESTKGIEEERRLCYVAITRAKKELFISTSTNRLMFGKTTIYSPSRFIKEMPESDIEKISKKQELPAYKQKDYVYKSDSNSYKTIERKGLSSEIKVGDKVSHDKFGVGVVVSVSDGLGKVAFSVEHGLKSLMLNHPSIKKVN